MCLRSNVQKPPVFDCFSMLECRFLARMLFFKSKISKTQWFSTIPSNKFQKTNVLNDFKVNATSSRLQDVLVITPYLRRPGGLRVSPQMHKNSMFFNVFGGKCSKHQCFSMISGTMSPQLQSGDLGSYFFAEKHDVFASCKIACPKTYMFLLFLRSNAQKAPAFDCFSMLECRILARMPF